MPDTTRTRCACACFSDTHVCYRRLGLCLIQCAHYHRQGLRLIQCAQGMLVLAFSTRMCAPAGWGCARYNTHKVCLCLLFQHACVVPQAGLVPDTTRTRDACCRFLSLFVVSSGARTWCNTRKGACVCFASTHACCHRLDMCMMQHTHRVLVVAVPILMCTEKTELGRVLHAQGTLVVS